MNCSELNFDSPAVVIPILRTSRYAEISSHIFISCSFHDEPFNFIDELRHTKEECKRQHEKPHGCYALR